MKNVKKVQGTIIAMANGKADNKNVLLTTKKEAKPLSIEMAKLLAGEDATPADIVELIQDSENVTYAKVWVSKKLLSHLVLGDSSVAITLADLKGKGFSCEFHQKGDVLNDGTEVTDSNVLVNNDTVVID